MAVPRDGSTPSSTERDFHRLRLYNLGMGILHSVQAIAILALANGFSLPVTTSFLEGPPGSDRFSAPSVAFEVPLGPAVALFLAISAADHFLLAGPAYGWYRRNLGRGINYARWYEYALSASLMIVLIAMVSGVRDAGALVALFAVNATMLFFGLLMETQNEGRARPDWTAYVFGCVAGVVPWAVIAYQVAGAERGAGDVPGFVYGILVSLFVLFNSFAVNMFLQYRRAGPWRNYLFGEGVYQLLSLVAKSALAWQVFANALAG